jgi:hypothetical protein
LGRVITGSDAPSRSGSHGALHPVSSRSSVASIISSRLISPAGS